MQSTTMGFSASQYRIMDGYPNDSELKTNELWPTITVDIDSLFGRSVELGSKQWPSFPFTIDVFAKTDSQRDDIVYNLWKELNESNYTLYDFNSGFPTSTVNANMYNGINSLGDYYLDDLSTFNLNPPEFTEILGAKHHAVIDGVINLPNI